MDYEFKRYKDALEKRDKLILDAGLVIIRNSDSSMKICSQKVLDNGQAMTNCNGKIVNGNLQDVNNENNDELELANDISLISKQAANMLDAVSGQTLEAKLSLLLDENKSLKTAVNDARNEIEHEKERYQKLNDSLSNNSLYMTTEMQAEIQRKFSFFF